MSNMLMNQSRRGSKQYNSRVWFGRGVHISRYMAAVRPGTDIRICAREKCMQSSCYEPSWTNPLWKLRHERTNINQYLLLK
jgi:hypothetical protein